MKLHKLSLLFITCVLTACGMLQAGVEYTATPEKVVTPSAQVQFQSEPTITATIGPSPTASVESEPDPTLELIPEPYPISTPPALSAYQTINPDTSPIFDLVYLRDGSALNILTGRGVYVYQGDTLQEKWLWPQPATRTDVALSPDGRLAAYAIFVDQELMIDLWDIVAAQRLRTIKPEHSFMMAGLTFSQNGELLAVHSDEGIVEIWDVNSGELVRTLGDASLSGVVFQSMAFSPDGKTFSAGMIRIAYIWDLETNMMTKVDLYCFSDIVYDLAYAPDGSGLTAACGIENDPSGCYSFINMTTLTFEWASEAPAIHQAVYVPAGNFVALGEYNGWLWSVPEQLPRDMSLGVIFSLLSYGHGESLVEEGVPFDESGKLLGVEHDVTALAFSPDGRTLASGSADGSVLLTDVGNVLPAPALSVTPTPALPSFASNTSASGCAIPVGQEVHTRSEAYLWSEPDATQAEINWTLEHGETLYVLDGPTEGFILKTGDQKGWFWQVSFEVGGQSAGWIWQGRIQECP